MNSGLRRLDKVRLKPCWPTDRQWHVVGFGLNAVDWICVLPHYPDHNTKIQIDHMQKLGGGQVATASAICARYGLKVRYVGRVGDDEIGDFSLRSLAGEPMDISCVEQVSDAASQFAFIMVDRPTGERTILWDRDPKLNYRPADLKREWITGGMVLHLDGHDEPASIQAAEWARESGMRICLDVDKIQPEVEKLLRLTDYALPSVDFVRRFTGIQDWERAVVEVDKATPGLTGVTLGKDGCAVAWEGQAIQVPGLSVKAVDTTGAGDIFHGAFIYALFQDWSLLRMLRFANAAGALSCTRLGARGGIPPLQEVLDGVRRLEEEG